MFSGSYDPDDVLFLLKPVRLEPTPVAEKELLIQSGQRHYSEMIGPEPLPSQVYLRIFHEAMERQKTRFARHLLQLATLIAEARPGPVALVSLARAGTPVGVLLTRILRKQLGRVVAHYSISIIRDRGLDAQALRFVLSRHSAAAVVFVDGWTGKGVIAAELRKSVAAFNEREGENLSAELFAVADLCGVARAATGDDYLIPSSVLGCTISGLVSRSILNSTVVGPGDYHGCVYYHEFHGDDLSRWFVDAMASEIAKQNASACTVKEMTPAKRDDLRRRNAAFLRDVRERYDVRDVNHVKPGIGEATRVLLRRVPDRLLLRDLDHPDIEHLRVLADEKGVRVQADAALPFLAAALIREVLV